MLGAIFGFGCGFFGSMPVTGPIALIVFKSSLSGNFGLAMRVVVGATVAEIIYCALATFGYAQILSAYPHAAYYIRYIGAIFLIILGIVFFFQKVKVEEHDPTKPVNNAVGFISGFVVSILNPTLFLTWGSAAGTVFSHIKSPTQIDLILFPIAAGLGIITWFAILLEILKKYRARIGERFGLYAIRGAAMIMLGSGGFLFIQAAS